MSAFKIARTPIIVRSLLPTGAPKLARKLRIPFLSSFAQQVRMTSYGGKVAYPPPVLDELPVPQGSWQKYDDEMNRKYSMHLIFGSTFFALTVMYVLFSDKIFFNASPPSLPGMEKGPQRCLPPPPPKKC